MSICYRGRGNNETDIGFVNHEEDSRTYDDDVSIFMNHELEAKYSNYVKREVSIQGKKSFLLWTLVHQLPLLPYDLNQRMLIDVPLQATTKKLYSYGGNQLPVKGSIEVVAEFNGDKRNVIIIKSSK